MDRKSGLRQMLPILRFADDIQQGIERMKNYKKVDRNKRPFRKITWQS